MTQKQKATMYAQIEKHGYNLNAIFQTKFDNITLCKKLRILEGKIDLLTTDYCNTGNDHEQAINKHLNSVKLILTGDTPNTAALDAIFVNHDPRGYALKLKDTFVRENNISIDRDFGGYGILAPDYSPNC